MGGHFRRPAQRNSIVSVWLELSASKDFLRMARAVINRIMSAPNVAR
jgi:hypothetical protein